MTGSVYHKVLFLEQTKPTDEMLLLTVGERFSKMLFEHWKQASGSPAYARLLRNYVGAKETQDKDAKGAQTEATYLDRR